MSDSKAAIFILFGVLVLMTGVFTAFSADENSPLVVGSADEEGFILVNGDEVTEGEFTSRVATVEQNLVMLTAQAESMPDDQPLMSRLVDIMENTPPETVALASLVLDLAIYQEALNRGHEPDSAVIRGQVEQERELFGMIEENPEEFGVDAENVAAYRENIEEVGEERYWTEHYPEILEKQSAVQELQAAVEESDEDWTALQQEVYRNADVEINDPDAIAPATVEGALTYMESVWELTEDIPASS